LHNLGGSGLDVVVTSAEGLTAGCGSVALEAGGVLLEGGAARAIAGGVGVDWAWLVKCLDADGASNLLPMADPAPPALPVAAVIAAWPATRLLVAKRPKETMVALEKNILSRSKMQIIEENRRD